MAALFGILEDRVDWFAKNVLYFSLLVGKGRMCLSSRGNTGTHPPVENVSSAGGGGERAAANCRSPTPVHGLSRGTPMNERTRHVKEATGSLGVGARCPGSAVKKDQGLTT